MNDGSIIVPPLKVVEYNEYDKSMRDFIAPVISIPESFKLNKFGTKYKSYANALCKNKNSE